VPILWRSEFRNALPGLVRQRSLTVEEASASCESRRGHAGSKGVYGFDLGGSSTRFEIEMLG
jgi:hypothetical protein